MAQIYLVNWKSTDIADPQDFAVEMYSVLSMATDRHTSIEKDLDRTAKVFRGVADFDGMGGPFLVKMFNALTGKDQKSFHDLATAKRQTWEALTTAHPHPDAGKTDDEPSTETNTPPTDGPQVGTATEGTETTAEAAPAPAKTKRTRTKKTPAPKVEEKKEEGQTDMATKVAAKTKTKKAPKQPKGRQKGLTRDKSKPGVIDTIVDLLQSGGGTIEKLAEKLHKKFPERELDALASTIRTQVNRLPKAKKDGGRNLKVKTEKTEGSNVMEYRI